MLQKCKYRCSNSFRSSVFYYKVSQKQIEKSEPTPELLLGENEKYGKKIL